MERLALAIVRTPAEVPVGFSGLGAIEHLGGSSMPTATTRQLLRRHAVAFAIAFVSLTTYLLTNYAIKRVPEMRARGVPTGTIVEFVLLAVPFTAAMTIPLGVFLAVLWVFTRLGAKGMLTAARGERHGVRRLVTPVVWAAAAVAALTLVFNDQIVPRANARLSVLQAGRSVERGDREMTIGELRTAARDARANVAPDAAARAASLEVEIQKKYALAAACVVFALTGVALALLFPHGGVALMILALPTVFATYYVGLIAGESLADRLLVSPFVAMWMANALLLVPALLVVWWRTRWPRAPRGAESLAIGG